MLYWLIPYLVAYNASSSCKWKYGPEHVFKAEIYSHVTALTGGGHLITNVKMELVCRPIDSSLIQCRINSGTLETYRLIPGFSATGVEERVIVFGGEDVFHVAFDEKGMSRVWFSNRLYDHIQKEIRAVIGTMHWGMSLEGKQFQNYDSLESSIIGTCQTQFNIAKRTLPENSDNDGEVLQEYNLFVPSLTEHVHDDMIVIGKNRDPKSCVKKTPYLYGDDPYAAKGPDGERLDVETLITHSESKISLGRKSFSASTENRGVRLYSRKGKPDNKTEIKVGEFIRISLEDIRPAELQLSLTNVDAGFEPGTPWSEPIVQNNVQFDPY